MITIHIWNENTAQAGRDAHEDRGGDSTCYEFESDDELREFLEGFNRTRFTAPAGRDQFLNRMALAMESYLA